MIYSVCDLETGSLYPQTGAIVSVAVVFLSEDLTPVGHYYSVVKDYPYKVVDDKALEVNGFTREMISKGRLIDDVLDDLARMFVGNVMVNHNSKFDCGFLNERGFRFTESIDTLLLARKYWPGEKNNLAFACEQAGIPVENAHNALYDARMTAKLLQKFALIPSLDALTPIKINF